MTLRILTLAVAQLFDLATFSLMVGRHGIRAEGNPLVARLFTTSGLELLTLGKVALIVLIASLVVAATAAAAGPSWRRALVGGMPLAVGIAAGLIGGITNAASYLA